jgi:hypothetical protein
MTNCVCRCFNHVGKVVLRYLHILFAISGMIPCRPNLKNKCSPSWLIKRDIWFDLAFPTFASSRFVGSSGSPEHLFEPLGGAVAQTSCQGFRDYISPPWPCSGPPWFRLQLALHNLRIGNYARSINKTCLFCDDSHMLAKLCTDIFQHCK